MQWCNEYRNWWRQSIDVFTQTSYERHLVVIMTPLYKLLFFFRKSLRSWRNIEKEKGKNKKYSPRPYTPPPPKKKPNNPKKPKQLCTTKYRLNRNVFISFHRIYNYCIINLWRKVICIFMQYDILGVIATPEAKNITFLASTTVS